MYMLIKRRIYVYKGYKTYPILKITFYKTKKTKMSHMHTHQKLFCQISKN